MESETRINFNLDQGGTAMRRVRHLTLPCALTDQKLTGKTCGSSDFMIGSASWMAFMMASSATRLLATPLISQL